MLSHQARLKKTGKILKVKGYPQIPIFRQAIADN